MRAIKFSHDTYKKFFLKDSRVEEGDVVELIGVSVCEISKLSKEFKTFDSQFGFEDEPEYYPLPEQGKVIVLFFCDGNCDILPTIRRWTKQKEQWYKEGIGKDHEILITEVKK